MKYHEEREQMKPMKCSLRWISYFQIFGPNLNFFQQNVFSRNPLILLQSPTEYQKYFSEKSVKVENLKDVSTIRGVIRGCSFFWYPALLFAWCLPHLSPVSLNLASSVPQTIQPCRAPVIQLSEAAPAAEVESNYIQKLKGGKGLAFGEAWTYLRLKHIWNCCWNTCQCDHEMSKLKECILSKCPLPG